MATSVVFPRVQFFTNNGRPLIGGRIETYIAGTSSRAPTYKDAAKAQPNTNPIILDGRGEASIYLAEGVEYKFVVRDAAGALILTQEPVYGAIWPNAAEWPSDVTLSYMYMLDAKAAAGAIGPIKFYDTRAQAQGDIGSLQPGDIVEVASDETMDNARTRYKVQLDALVFVVNLDQVRVDITTPTGAVALGGFSTYALLRQYTGPATRTSVGVLGTAAARGIYGTFWRDTTDTTSADDGGVVIVDALGRRWKRDFRGAANVAWWGAALDGITDDTAALQRAANYGGRLMAAGPIKISGQINLAKAGTWLDFGGLISTKVTQATAATRIFNVTANEVKITGVTLGFSVLQSVAGTAIYCTGANFEFSDFKIEQCDIGVEFHGSIIGILSDFKIYNYRRAGIYFQQSADINISSFLIDAVNATNGSLAGIYLADFCEALIFSSGDVLNGEYSLQSNASVNTQGQTPSHNSFQSVYLDGSAKGSILDRTHVTTFSNCWFSAGRSGAGFPGLRIGDCSNIVFGQTRFVGCGSHGCQVTQYASRVGFSNCLFLGNSQTAGANVADGLHIDANAHDITVTGGFARNDYFAGTQRYGIEVGNGSTNVLISSFGATGNGTAGLHFGTGLSGCKVDNVSGWPTAQGAALSAGTSPFNYQAGPSNETLYISRGVVTSIITMGLAVYAETDKTICLGPNEGLQINFTEAPYINRVIH